MAEQEANAGGMKKELTLFNFFTIGFGAIIGTGWVLLVGDWMVLGGGPVPAMIAFGIGAILLVPIGMVFGELTAAIPISGGIIEYVERTFGRKLGFITGWMLLLGNAPLCPWEAIAISKLLTTRFAEFPVLAWLRSVKLYTILGADVYLWPTVIALGFAVLVIFLNLKGAGAAAKLSSFLTKALLAGMILAMVISFMTGSPSNAMPVFSQVNDAAGGNATTATSLLGGVIAVLVILRRLRHHSAAGGGGLRQHRLEEVRPHPGHRPSCLRCVLSDLHLQLRHHHRLARVRS